MGKRYRVVLAFTAIASLVLSQGAQVARGQTSGRPNVVVIMIDDYDLTSLWTLVGTGKMPNLTRYFIQGGYIFSNSFSAGGLGGPSRASVLTGQYPHNHHVTWGFPPRDVELLNESSTVATWLKTAGYRTGHMGRYVTGYGWSTSATAIPPGWDDWNTLIDPTSNNTLQYRMNLNGTVVDFGELAAEYGVELHQTDVVTALATSFVENAPAFQQPFFLMITPGVFNLATEPTYNVCPGVFAPYYDPFWGGSPYGAAQQPPARHLDTIYGNTTLFALPRPPSFNEVDVSDKTSWTQYPRYYTPAVIDCLQKRYWRKLELMLSVDEMIGSVFGALERTGALANTVAIFTADNGELDGQHRAIGKGVPFEEAIRIPLFLRPRGGTPPTVISRLVLNIDLAPTIATFAQATPTHVTDGRSLVPLLAAPETLPWRRVALLEYEGDLDPIDNLPLPPSYFALRSDRTQPRMYARYPTVSDGVDGELYDLSQDPYELTNLYLDPARAAERARMESWLAALKTCRGLGCQLLEAYFSLY
jgi:N-acetylglucosamine-6-sulfatase